jgi:hypothetical protein
VEKGIMADIYLEVRKRRGHIFFEWNKCLCHHPLIWPETLNRSRQSNPHFAYLHAIQSTTATFKYTYRAPLRRIWQEYSANVALSTFQSLKRIQPNQIRWNNTNLHRSIRKKFKSWFCSDSKLIYAQKKLRKWLTR